ncbi:hypothetical protein BH20ACT16_BH20ACT16_12640 [soil metagenome]
MQANPPDLADYDYGEGVLDFRRRRSAVSYFIGDRASEGPVLEQVIDRDVTYLRIGGSAADWEQAQLGDPDEFAPAGDANGFLELLDAPGEVRPLTCADEIDGSLAQRYALAIEPPRSTLRDRLASRFGVRGPTRFWLEAWIDAEGMVRRIATCDHEPNEDGSLRTGSVRTIVEFDDLGVPVAVDIPRTTASG